jgi:hypothetical protein
MPNLTQIKPVLPSSHNDMMLSFALHLTQAQPRYTPNEVLACEVHDYEVTMQLLKVTEYGLEQVAEQVPLTDYE